MLENFNQTPSKKKLFPIKNPQPSKDEKFFHINSNIIQKGKKVNWNGQENE